MQRKLQNYISIVLKGLGMGAAEVVPGVSCGTISFITGIYEELLNSLKSINHIAIKILFTKGIAAAWNHINGKFLLALSLGILLSIVSLAKALEELFISTPILLWSFFFGLIVASIYIIAKKISSWDPVNGAAILFGIILAYFITSATPATTSNSYWFIFISGALVISAIILPGISGSFILLLLGKYQFIINAFSNLKVDIIAIFGAGTLFGILAFSNFLSWLLKKYHNATTAVITGFMIGSLNKVWPWKQTTEWFTDENGILKPLTIENVSPSAYSEVTHNESQLWLAITLAIVGFAIIIIFEKIISQESTE